MKRERLPHAWTIVEARGILVSLIRACRAGRCEIEGDVRFKGGILTDVFVDTFGASGMLFGEPVSCMSLEDLPPFAGDLDYDQFRVSLRAAQSEGGELQVALEEKYGFPLEQLISEEY